MRGRLVGWGRSALGTQVTAATAVASSDSAATSSGPPSPTLPSRPGPTDRSRIYFKQPTRRGATFTEISRDTFLARLAALVPPPRFQSCSYAPASSRTPNPTRSRGGSRSSSATRATSSPPSTSRVARPHALARSPGPSSSERGGAWVIRHNSRMNSVLEPVKPAPGGEGFVPSRVAVLHRRRAARAVRALRARAHRRPRDATPA